MGAKNFKEKTYVSPWARVGYGLGDTGLNLTWQMVSLYVLFFYTDVIGLAAGAIAVLMIVARFWDAINDVIMGVIVDKTHTKMGSCRPYFIWGLVPYAVFAILLFSGFGNTMGTKLVWAYIGYLGFTAAYTFINIPYSSILPAMTDNYHEQTTVNTIRMIFSRIGTVLVTLLGMKLVGLFGNGNQKLGFRVTMAVFSLVACVFFVITFVSTKERFPISNKESVSMKDSIRALKGNGPWFIMLCINIVNWIGIAMYQQSIVYVTTYVMGMQNFPYMIIFVLGTFAGLAITPALSKKLTKRNLFILGEVIIICGFAGCLLVVSARQIPLLIVMIILGGIGLGISSPLSFSMLADVVDYGEWKTGIRASGLTYSAASFGIKAGTGIAGAVGVILLESGGYIAGAQQTPGALFAIKMVTYIVPICMCILTIVLLLFYKLDKKSQQIKVELQLKRDVAETIENK